MYEKKHFYGINLLQNLFKGSYIKTLGKYILRILNVINRNNSDSIPENPQTH